MAIKPYYDDGNGIVIYHGDSRDIIQDSWMEGEDAVVISDPPFGISHESGWNSSWSRTQIANDSTSEARDCVLDLLNKFPAAIFGSWKVSRPESTKAILIWDKGAAFGMGDLSFPWKNSFEEIYIIGDGWKHDRRDEGVIRGHFCAFSEAQGRLHPNEKPVSLLQYLMLRHPATTVIDPFMGSGPTCKAAKNLGKKFIGIEIEERYCEAAARRLQQEVFDFDSPTQTLLIPDFS